MPISEQIGTKPAITINIARFWAGATADEIIGTVLSDLLPYYDFVVSEDPQVLLYGPYSGAVPPGRHIKVFIGCENVRPLMNECDWAFGVEHEEYVRSDRYMRIARWGDDSYLIQKGRDWSEVLRKKTRFCAFLYAKPIGYREEFFRQLSRYKPVDAPGRSMNNMASIDPIPGKIDWDAKIEFLRSYKFVVAFENSSWPGYNTEKLTDPIKADCIPIYWGDPEIGRSYNTARFINGHEYLPRPAMMFPRFPYHRHSLKVSTKLTTWQRFGRRANRFLFDVEQRIWLIGGFDKLIDRIIAIDRDDDLYLQYLRQPPLLANRLPDRSQWIRQWHKIFKEAANRDSRSQGAATIQNG
jgi:alpha(1,3/1,4) fucosyltransferase